MTLYQPCLDWSNYVHVLRDQRQDAGPQRPRRLPPGLVERPGVERIDQRQYQAGIGRGASLAHSWKMTMACSS
jgi:hypothetical protein